MVNTNMDLKKKASPDGPQLEFTLPLNDLQIDLEVGQKGEVIIPVEVTQLADGMVSFRKTGKAKSGEFRSASLSDMEDDIGVAER